MPSLGNIGYKKILIGVTILALSVYVSRRYGVGYKKIAMYSVIAIGYAFYMYQMSKEPASNSEIKSILVTEKKEKKKKKKKVSWKDEVKSWKSEVTIGSDGSKIV